jgi:uncharacterized protein with FMN-binding domain
MGSHKFFVVHLKELIKTVVFVVLGIILICLLVYFFIPKEKEHAAIYEPGSYAQAIILNDNPIEVMVTVDSDKILSVELLNMSEEQLVFYPLIKPTLHMLADEIVKSQSLDITIPDETIHTSGLLLKAVDMALSKARL